MTKYVMATTTILAGLIVTTLGIIGAALNIRDGNYAFACLPALISLLGIMLICIIIDTTKEPT